ncbi:MAG: glycosyltransferase [Proteobacteria bacterium]|nr:glycosyltransferase [Pseudomonadota bacterium]
MSPAAAKISVVIPVCNCELTIAQCLDSVVCQDYPNYELLVVDDGSTDRTVDICQTYPNIKMIRVTNGGPSRARNIGIKMATGEILAFTDGDCIAEPNWLSELTRGFDRPRVAGVGGDQKSPHDETVFGRRVQDVLKLLGVVTYYTQTISVMTETPHNPSCNAAYLKSVLAEVGGFDENLWPGEDVDLDIRIRLKGYKLIYNPDAVVRHYRPKTYGGFSRMMRRYGASAWQLFGRYGFFRVLQYEPIILIMGLILGTSMILWSPWSAMLLFIPWLILYFWFLAKTGGVTASVHAVILFALIFVNWNWGFFTGYRYRPWGMSQDL